MFSLLFEQVATCKQPRHPAIFSAICMLVYPHRTTPPVVVIIHVSMSCCHVQLFLHFPHVILTLYGDEKTIDAITNVNNITLPNGRGEALAPTSTRRRRLLSVGVKAPAECERCQKECRLQTSRYHST